LRKVSSVGWISCSTQLSARIDQLETVVLNKAKEDEACQRLTAMGVGPVTATALIAGGMVPTEHSSSGKQTLLGISKRGNSYLRRLFVQGARSVLQQRHRQSSGLSSWLSQLLARKHQNVVVVAMLQSGAPFTVNLSEAQDVSNVGPVNGNNLSGPT